MLQLAVAALTVPTNPERVGIVVANRPSPPPKHLIVGFLGMATSPPKQDPALRERLLGVRECTIVAGSVQLLGAAGHALRQELERLANDQALAGTSAQRTAVAIRDQLASMGSRPTQLLAVLNEDDQRFPLRTQHSSLDALELLLERLHVVRRTHGEGAQQQGSNLFTLVHDSRNRCLDCNVQYAGRSEEASVFSLKPSEFVASGAALGDFISQHAQQVDPRAGERMEGLRVQVGYR